MAIYWKPGDSLKKRKYFLKIIILFSWWLFTWVLIFDSILILFFNAEMWKILIWTLIMLLFLRKKLLSIYHWYFEIYKLEKNIEKGYEWELEIARILQAMESNDPKISIFHDVFIGHENIDHIILYDNKLVILIETKALLVFPSGWILWKINRQVKRQWTFLNRETWLFIYPLCVFTNAFVDPFKHESNIEYINKSYLERKIRLLIENNKQNYNSNATFKIKQIQEKYIPKNLSYRTLFVW